ncbi:multiple monosaccharide ABC transporter permease [Microbacterium sp. NPDC077391]|uniref:Xylose transport system permease protein XylH n=1 Tax=Microbacterium commune TaxID=2762219 RepID=A0ABR8W6R7_9MICO|nr:MULTISPECIES: multiple monosaccharide ABC transporter permease [Microbacterium]MBD8012719.1 sugar ABC transporter permease [Microbacterium commune]OIU86198.1 ABC transporter permease [Microbacterium sp. AR7-10]
MNNVFTEVKDLLTQNLRTSGIYIAFIAIVAIFTITTGGKLLSPENVTNIVLQNAHILIMALGMILVIVGGHIDLSVGSVLAFASAVSAVLVIKNGMPWWVGIIAAIVVGIIVGVWQGFWVAIVGIPAFIVTLAGMLLFRGLTWLVLNNVSLSPFSQEYRNVASGFLDSLFGSITIGQGQGLKALPQTVDIFTLVIGLVAVVGLVVSSLRTRRARQGYNQPVESAFLFILKLVVVSAVLLAFAWALAYNRGFPIVLIIVAVLILVYQVVTNRTVFGRHVYAVGGNLSAARLSGVNVKSVNFWIFVNMGFLTGIAAAVFSSRSNGAQPGMGNMFELDVIAACFIGGASTMGGVGRVGGALVGGLVMAVMSNGMQLMGVPQAAQQIVKGLVLLLAVAFDIYNKRRAGTVR